MSDKWCFTEKFIVMNKILICSLLIKHKISCFWCLSGHKLLFKQGFYSKKIHYISICIRWLKFHYSLQNTVINFVYHIIYSGGIYDTDSFANFFWSIRETFSSLKFFVKILIFLKNSSSATYSLAGIEHHLFCWHVFNTLLIKSYFRTLWKYQQGHILRVNNITVCIRPNYFLGHTTVK